MIVLLLILIISVIIASLKLFERQEEIKIHLINTETRKVYCVKNDKDGKYTRGKVGYTISKVEFGKVLVSFGKDEAYWIPVDEISIIEEKNTTNSAGMGQW